MINSSFFFFFRHAHLSTNEPENLLWNWFSKPITDWSARTSSNTVAHNTSSKSTEKSVKPQSREQSLDSKNQPTSKPTRSNSSAHSLLLTMSPLKVSALEFQRDQSPFPSQLSAATDLARNKPARSWLAFLMALASKSTRSEKLGNSLPLLSNETIEQVTWKRTIF